MKPLLSDTGLLPSDQETLGKHQCQNIMGATSKFGQPCPNVACALGLISLFSVCINLQILKNVYI